MKILQISGKGELSHKNRLMRSSTLGQNTLSLSRQNKGERLGSRAIRGLVKTRFADAGIVGNRKTTHNLRHNAITNAIRHGAQPLQVQAMARHRSFDTTLSYCHEVGRIASPAEDLIDYSNGGKSEDDGCN